MSLYHARHRSLWGTDFQHGFESCNACKFEKSSEVTIQARCRGEDQTMNLLEVIFRQSRAPWELGWFILVQCTLESTLGSRKLMLSSLRVLLSAHYREQPVGVWSVGNIPGKNPGCPLKTPNSHHRRGGGYHKVYVHPNLGVETQSALQKP